MICVFLGPPGAGKGTQARLLLREYPAMVQLSTGDILRDAVGSDPDIGPKIADLLRAGALVPDGIVIDLIKKKLENLSPSSGVILDGFPRTVEQAVSLNAILKDMGRPLNLAISLKVDESVLVERVSGRFTCSSCGEGYHDVYKKPKISGICDECGGKEFFRRDDDNATIVRSRLRSYNEQTKPLLKFYAQQGVLKEIYGLADIQIVFSEIKSLINTMQPLTF